MTFLCLYGLVVVLWIYITMASCVTASLDLCSTGNFFLYLRYVYLSYRCSPGFHVDCFIQLVCSFCSWNYECMSYALL